MSSAIQRPSTTRSRPRRQDRQGPPRGTERGAVATRLRTMGSARRRSTSGGNGLYSGDRIPGLGEGGQAQGPRRHVPPAGDDDRRRASRCCAPWPSSPSRPRTAAREALAQGPQRRRDRRRRSPSVREAAEDLPGADDQPGPRRRDRRLPGQVADSIADNFETEVQLRGKIKAALVYPVVVLIIASLAVIGMLIFIVPVFEEMYTDLGGELPLPTRILVVLSQRHGLHRAAAHRRSASSFAVWWRKIKDAERPRAASTRSSSSCPSSASCSARSRSRVSRATSAP